MTHPLHPPVVHFAFGLCGAALLFDVAALLLANPTLYAIGFYNALAGVGAGLLAALVGVVDAARLPDSAAKTLRWHVVCAVAAIALFGVALALRKEPTALTGGLTLRVLVLEGAGGVALVVGGYLGGELAYNDELRRRAGES